MISGPVLPFGPTKIGAAFSTTKFFLAEIGGTGCSYELDTWSGTLTIYPTDGASGEMARVRDALSDDGDFLDAIRSVTVKEGVVAPADSSYLFGDLRAMESLDLSGLDTSRTTDIVADRKSVV